MPPTDVSYATVITPGPTRPTSRPDGISMRATSRLSWNVCGLASSFACHSALGDMDAIGLGVGEITASGGVGDVRIAVDDVPHAHAIMSATTTAAGRPFICE